MPRYYFHLHNDADVTDEEGTELPDLAAACEHARAEAVHMAAASISEHQRLFGRHRVDVADESGAVLHSLQFGEVVEIRP